MQAEPRTRGGGAGAVALVALPAVVATVALVLVTRKGAYVSPDSAFYVGVARNLVDGQGLEAPPGSVPLSHFPPLFPMMLAAVGKVTGVDPLKVAGWLNPVLLGANALAVAAVAYRWTRSLAAGLGASVATVVSLDLLVYHGSALSEPLFLFLSIGCLAATARYLEAGGGRWFAAAAALAAAATLTRYTGVALIVTGIVAVFGRARYAAEAPGGQRVGGGGWAAVSKAAVFLAVAAAPVTLWLSWSGSGDRALALHPPGAGYLVGTARSLSAWVLPRWLGWPVRGYAAVLVLTIVAALVTSALVTAARETAARETAARAGRPLDPGHESGEVGRGRPSPTPLLVVIGSFVAAYLAIMLATRIFLDASGDGDLRLLTPLHLALTLTLPVVVVSFWPAWARRSDTRTRLLAGVVAAVLVLHTIQAIVWVVDGLGDDSIARRGLAAAAWDRSTVMAAIEALPADVEVYSNAPEAVYLFTKRPSRSLPARTDYLTSRANPDYADELAAIRPQFESRRAHLAWFDAAAWRRAYLPTEAQVRAALGIGPEAAVADSVGRLYPAPGPA